MSQEQNESCSTSLKVLLIQSPLGRKETPVYPLGLTYIAEALLGKHQVEIVDANTQSREEIRKTIARFKPEVIGLGLRNIDTASTNDPYFYFEHFPPFVKWIKGLSSESTLVVGGSGFSIFPWEVLRSCPEIDFGINLEGELTFPALLNNLNRPETVPGVYYRNRDGIAYSGLSSLPDFSAIHSPSLLPDLTPYQDSIWQFGVQTKRGCPLRCLYCNYPYLSGEKVRLRNPIDVVNQLHQLEKEHGIGRFFFSDSIFGQPREHAERICREIVRQRLHLKWSAYFSINGFDKAFLELATKAGCELFIFSPDGLRQRTLDALSKGITEDQIRQVMDLFKHSDYPEFTLEFLFNVPGATFGDFILLIRAKLSWRWKYRSLRDISVTNMRIYPYTPLHELSIKDGLIGPERSLLRPTFYDPWPLRAVSFMWGWPVRLVREIVWTYRGLRKKVRDSMRPTEVSVS